MAHETTEVQRIYHFGDVVIDFERCEIRVAGRSVEVQPKVFDLLRYLIENRHRVVDKSELMENLWPESVVTEASLTQALKKARKIVGDDGDRQRVIRTVQRRGFRFIATLETLTAAQPPASRAIAIPIRSLRPTPASVSSAAAPFSDKSRQPASAHETAAGASIAVLPFVDMSPAFDQQYFCDGMVEEITSALSRIEGLRVAARTSAFAFQGTSVDAREIAQCLGVTSLVEGSVRRLDDRLRVTAKLLDASTGFQRWSRRWDRSLVDVFAIQDEIAEQVAAALKLHLTRDERTALHSSRAHAVGAYDRYLRGLAFMRRFGRRSQRFALEMFHQAIALDPQYAPAWAGVATSHVLLYLYADATEERRQLARDAGTRAVELDPLSAEAHVAFASASILRADNVGADESFVRAQTLNPRLYEAWYFHGRSYASRGEHDRAVQCYEKAALVRPEDYEALNLATQSYMSLRAFDEAGHTAKRSISAAERALALHPEDVRALSMSAWLLAEVGRREDAKSWTERACALEPDEPIINYNAACAYVRLGDHEKAIEHLERLGIEDTAYRSWMENDWALDPLRENERFRALIARAR